MKTIILRPYDEPVPYNIKNTISRMPDLNVCDITDSEYIMLSSLVDAMYLQTQILIEYNVPHQRYILEYLLFKKGYYNMYIEVVNSYM